MEVATALGWEIVAASEDDGRFEATDTTFWFGFKDDVVVRIRPEGDGSRIDLRSVPCRCRRPWSQRRTDQTVRAADRALAALSGALVVMVHRFVLGVELFLPSPFTRLAR